MKKATRTHARVNTLAILPDASPETVRAHAVQLCTLLEKKRAELGISDTPMSNGEFCKLVGIDGSTYGRVVAALLANEHDKYSVKDWRPMIAKFQGGLQLIASRAASQERKKSHLGTGPLLFSYIPQIFTAVENAMTEKRDKFIVLLGKTGAGKTSIRALVEEKFPTKVVSLAASQPWVKNYAPLFKAIAREIGISKPPRATYELQEKVLEVLKAGQRVILIDEGQNIGYKTLLGMKHIAEQTACVFVILSTPAQWKHVDDGDWDEVDQATNRIYLKQFLCADEHGKDQLLPDDVALYLEKHLPQFPGLMDAEQDQIIEFITTEALGFGLWNKVTALCDHVADLSLPDGPQGQELPIALSSFKAAASALQKLGRR